MYRYIIHSCILHEFVVLCNVKGLWSAADGEFDFAKCLNLEESDATAAAMTALADKLKSSECVCVCVCASIKCHWIHGLRWY